MSKLQITILVILGLLAFGAFGLVFTLPGSPMSLIPTPTLVPTFTPTITPTPTSTATPVILPPTWTPAPSEAPTITPTRSTRTPLAGPTQISTLNIPASAVILNGSGSGNTVSFGLPDGTVTINWTYYGVPGEGADIEYAYSIYQNDLTYQKATLDNMTSYYDRLKEEALNQGSARNYELYQSFLNGWINRYNTAIAAAKTKYDNAIAAHTSPFKATLYRSATGKIQPLIAVKGLYEGSFKQKTTKAYDYYLVVETSGQWSIRILP